PGAALGLTRATARTAAGGARMGAGLASGLLFVLPRKALKWGTYCVLLAYAGLTGYNAVIKGQGAGRGFDNATDTMLRGARTAFNAADKAIDKAKPHVKAGIEDSKNILEDGKQTTETLTQKTRPLLDPDTY